MSGPKSRRVFTALAKKLTLAHELVYNKVPHKYRKRYIKPLLLDKFPARVKPLNCLAVLLNVRGLRAPSIPEKEMVVGKSGKNTTVYLPGDTTILLINENGSMKMEVLGNTMLKLAFYRTMLHNLDVLNHDVSLFNKLALKK